MDMKIGTVVKVVKVPEFTRGVAIGMIGSIACVERHGMLVELEHGDCWWFARDQVEKLPPYCAGYRPLKTTFLPGSRVHYVDDDHPYDFPPGLITAVGSGWAHVVFDDSEDRASEEILQEYLRHVPYTRSPSWPWPPKSEQEKESI